MADKMGTEFVPDLQEQLERLCLEYQGLKYLLKHYLQTENPEKLLSEYCLLTANKSRVSRIFDGLSADLQSLPSEKLTAALVSVRAYL